MSILSALSEIHSAPKTKDMKMLLVKKIPEKEAIESFISYFPDADPMAVLAMINLLHVSTEVFSALDVHFARNNISQGRFHVLMKLSKAEHDACARGEKTPPAITPAEIAEFVDVTRATITGLLDKLESDELITRVPSKKDRRKQNIYLTDKGRNYMKTFLPEHLRRVGYLMSNLTPEESKELIRLLSKVKDAVPLVREP